MVEWLAERGSTVDPSTIYDGVRAFTPRCIDAARAHRAAVGRCWRVDETDLKVGKRWHDLYRAIDAHGQIVDAYLSGRRIAAAATALFGAVIDASTVTPTPVTSDTATCYPAALRAVLPTVEHRMSKYLNNGLEREPQPLKGPIRPMRWFNTVAGASNCSRGHALIRNLRCGFSSLTAHVPVHLRVATPWLARATSL